MSEAAPGIPDSAAFATPERAELASAIRALIDTVMSVEDVEADDAARGRAARSSSSRSGSGAAATRARATARATHGDYLPRSPIVGEASPLSPRFDWERSRPRADGTAGVEARGTFGAAYEGPPSFVHGGWVACTFDEVLGIANIDAGQSGHDGAG